MDTPVGGVICNDSTYANAPVKTPQKQPEKNGRLADYSDRDKPWDKHRSDCDEVADIYAPHPEFQRYAERMSACANLLGYGWENDMETGESAMRLRNAHFCRVRTCPVCQWRRSLAWKARFYQALPEVVEAYPKARWIFLTLTVRNCAIEDLGETLKQMNQSWQRLIQRKALRPVLGWVRTTEVTKGKDGSAHPHFHALLMVPPSWFTRHYIKHARWVELWGDCLKADYAPNVDVRVVKPKHNLKTGTDAPATPVEQQVAALQGAVMETMKYAVKPDDFVGGDEDDEAWFLEYTRQIKRKRFTATGGVLKDALKHEDEMTDEDLIGDNGDGAADEDESRIAFSWRPSEANYRRAPRFDT